MSNEHKEFLDELRESGVTNMFGASPYVRSKFGVDSKKADSILLEWMDSFK